MRQLGLVVHPSRPVGGALRSIAEWASSHGLAVGEVAVPGRGRLVADPVDAADCDVLLAVGGDGTALSALHTGAESSRPVLGIACGSLGVLTSVTEERVVPALDQLAAGEWTPMAVPGLEICGGEVQAGIAINDLAIIRDGPGQIIISITVDEVLYARISGDGLVVATALGSSAYTMAAGGPILAPGVEGIAVTPLAPHGGSSPPLVAGSASELALAIEPGRVGVRYELDGRRTSIAGKLVTVRQRADYATLVGLAESEPRLTGLRRRGLVLDSPRLLARLSRRAGLDPSALGDE